MSRPISLASVIDKNQIASNNVWLEMMQVTVLDTNGNTTQMLYFVRNNEPVIYEGNEYLPLNFDLNIRENAQQMPQLTVSAKDPTGIIRQVLEAHQGGVNFPVTFLVINTANMNAPPELQETFSVISARAPDTGVEMTLGAENPLRYSFPWRKQYQDRCPWLYKGPMCKYAGALTNCDYTMEGPNGCQVHNNGVNFGGFPGLQNLQQSL